MRFRTKKEVAIIVAVNMTARKVLCIRIKKNNSVKSLSEVFLHYIWSIESLNLSCSIKLFKKEKENRSYFFKDMALSTFSLNTDVSIMVPR